jgi:hypothetical protein
MPDRASPEEAVGLAWAEPRIDGSPMDGTRLRRRHPACCGAPDRCRTRANHICDSDRGSG